MTVKCSQQSIAIWELKFMKLTTKEMKTKKKLITAILSVFILTIALTYHLTKEMVTERSKQATIKKIYDVYGGGDLSEEIVYELFKK